MTNTFTVIPDLVSVETNIPKIKDFLLSRRLSFYKSGSPQKYHYQVVVQNQINLPVRFECRIGNFLVNGSKIYFRQDVSGGLGFKFSYDFQNKIFAYNKFYKYHFINLGNVYTIGRNLYHLIEYELAKNNLFIVLGAVVTKNNRTITFLAPNGNDKTTFVNKALKSGYSYVSENFFVLDIKNNLIHGISPVLKHMNKTSNNTLSEIFNQNNVSIIPKINDGEVYSLAFKNMSDKNTLMYNYIETYCKYYKKNNFTRTLAYLGQDNELLDKNYNKLEEYLSGKIKIIRSYQDIKI